MKIFFNFYLHFFSTFTHSFENTKIKIRNFITNKYKILIKKFQEYTDTNNYKTSAKSSINY